MLDTFLLLINIILGIALPLAVQRWDRARLTDRQRSGAWNTASWGAALYAFGPLSMLGWCWVTRQECARWRSESTWSFLWKSAALILASVLAAALIGAVIAGVDELIRRVAGV